MVHAVKNMIGNFGLRVGAFVNSVRLRLVSKINIIKDFDASSLTNEEKVLRGFRDRISDMGDDVKELEALFPVVEKFMSQSGIEPLSASMTFNLIRNKQLSKLVSALDKFEWSGSGSHIPNGKTEDAVGISDSLLESLMSASHADGKLSSWLATSDARWKRVADAEIDWRKNEIKKLQRTDPRNGKIAVWEREIKTLEKYWTLSPVK
jgi:hypothetical protein